MEKSKKTLTVKNSFVCMFTAVIHFICAALSLDIANKKFKDDDKPVGVLALVLSTLNIICGIIQTVECVCSIAGSYRLKKTKSGCDFCCDDCHNLEDCHKATQKQD